MEGDTLNCKSSYGSSGLKYIYCLENKEDTIYIQNKIENVDSIRQYRYYYKSGELRKKGKLLNDEYIFENIGYYKNGDIAIYQYYDVVYNRVQLLYEKQYLENGELDSIKYYVETFSHTEKFEQNRSDTIFIKLYHSNVDPDSLSILCTFDLDHNGTYTEDTIHYAGNIAPYIITPAEIGKFELRGNLVEIKGVNMIAEKEFKFKYEVLAKQN